MGAIHITYMEEALRCSDKLVTELENFAGLLWLFGHEASREIEAIKATAEEIQREGKVDEISARIRFGHGNRLMIFQNIVAAGTTGRPLFSSLTEARSYSIAKEKEDREKEVLLASEERARVEVERARSEVMHRQSEIREFVKKQGITEEELKALRVDGDEEDEQVLG